MPADQTRENGWNRQTGYGAERRWHGRWLLTESSRVGEGGETRPFLIGATTPLGVQLEDLSIHSLQ